jgi:hypothetical protein
MTNEATNTLIKINKAGTLRGVIKEEKHSSWGEVRDTRRKYKKERAMAMKRVFKQKVDKQNLADTKTSIINERMKIELTTNITLITQILNSSFDKVSNAISLENEKKYLETLNGKSNKDLKSEAKRITELLCNL